MKMIPTYNTGVFIMYYVLINSVQFATRLQVDYISKLHTTADHQPVFVSCIKK